ncbi:putative dithiol-disulfide isomerase involved in polyketide biosynthesis [Rivularia sp. PCC 7116]|uniref:DsbA family oxidoreductase n=1 Tax=Rivularia sp. PCC 7116 TaxID=373994 RepID=UPI00029F0FF4|nr:DsbA family oxidoreductase [Rivularia sp. PCC 7116]AFY56609.1 putative dithiol-disulfide isomerase involved in polyketide biosynthesis [Rivularia sp. PCC 7116]
MNLTIEITSDFICPWCLVAEKRLNKAIAQLNSSVNIERVWYPFELNPDMPEIGMERKIYRSQKFGSWEYSQQLDAKTILATQEDDINFRYDLMEFTPNTHKAHRLVWFASQQGKATYLAERIFTAYFTEGQNISSVEILANLAADIGIDRDVTIEFLQSDAGTQEVRDLENRAVSRGIRGVPSIRIGKEILSGAQPVEVFLSTLQNAVHELTEV